MLNIKKISSDRIDVELTGGLDSIEMATGLDRLISEAADMSNGKVLYRITDFEMPTIGALAVEFGRLPSLIGLLGKIDKCAVLSDESWLRGIGEIEGAILPGLEIRGFPYSDEAAAIEWLEGVDEEFDNVPV